MTDHVDLAHAELHEPKRIDNATTAQTGQVITPSGTTNGEGQLRNLTLTEITQAGHRDQTTGWAHYLDNVYNSGSKLAIGAGTRTKINNDGAKSGSISTYLAAGDAEYWNTGTNKVTPDVEGDSYLVRIKFEADVGAANDVDVELDVGGTVIWAERKEIHTPAATTLCFLAPILVDSSAKSSGIEIYFTPVAASNFWDIEFSVMKTHQQG